MALFEIPMVLNIKNTCLSAINKIKIQKKLHVSFQQYFF